MQTTSRRLLRVIVPFALLAVFSCRAAPSAAPQEEPKPIEVHKPIDAPPPVLEAPAIEEETPPPEEPAVEEAPSAAEPEEAEPVPFDPKTIPKEVYDSTKTDVQALIGRLNGIIRQRNYEVWVTFLGNEYRAALSSPAFLERISASAVLQKQRIVLRELRDYFIYVVVPSRANDRVDDIEFIGQNRVKAFTVDSKGQRLRLYDLEKTPTGWKIIN